MMQELYFYKWDPCCIVLQKFPFLYFMTQLDCNRYQQNRFAKNTLTITFVFTSQTNAAKIRQLNVRKVGKE